ncbi:MAG: hypothetical protein KBB37_01695 [Bacteroidia bacterium]|nr:hypothetical protein [Bacteroidia bacterium]MBP7259971.1 hypothetical protein [Bacteroidia bacterium]MBP9181214.1 hypothetical protein [Bacteroidia bacterium]MBP9723922.1 hypothetical protein [Bacteroidia bacterium]
MFNALTKYQSLIIYGMLIILTGIFLIAFQYKTSAYLQYAVAISILISMFFASVTAYKSKTMQVRFKYHELHAAGMLVYGIAVLFFSATIAKFLNVTSFFLIYYGTAEMIYCIWLFNLKSQISLSVLMTRLSIGFAIYLGSIVILTLYGNNQAAQLTGYGIVFLVMGIHILIYKPIMRTFENQATELV